MNLPQKMFYEFFIDRTKEDRKDEAKKLLEEGFDRQDAGTFDKAYLLSVTPKYFELIKPEAVEDIKDAMGKFTAMIKD